ncbi:MAG: fibronectin type III domain-containing protein [Acidobacteriota bacterium]
MKHIKTDIFIAVIASAVMLTAGVQLGHCEWAGPASPAGIQDNDTWATVMTLLENQKAVIELSEASVIIEVNSTDGDAGFQVFLDGEGWRKARIFDPEGIQVLNVHVGGGIRSIGGGTELFMETEEPEYEDLDEFEELIEHLPEGEFMFLAATTEGDWATGTAEFTHDVPAGPEIIAPLPDPGEECAADVLADFAVIEWHPVTTQLTGAGDIEIVGYQIIVENEDTERSFMVEVPAGVTLVTVSPEFLEAGLEYSFEILAIEESGNQTITESCFETAE